MSVLELTGEEHPTRVADDVAELTPEWLGEILSAGCGVGVRVSDVVATRVGTGQTGVSYRLRLTHDGAAAGAPGSVVVKLAAGTREQRALVAPGFSWEVGFYRHLAHRVRARTPRCWYAAITDDHHSFTLVLEDLAPAEPGRQADGCDVPRARDAVRNLADLHGPLWNRPLLAGGLSWLAPADAEWAATIGALHRDATDTFIDRYAEHLTARDAQTLVEAADLTEHWTASHAQPFSLVHGDYRLDNLMFPPSGGAVAALDWQTTMVAHPLRDVAYFLSMSLPPDARRAHERELVAEYHARLLAHGVRDFTLDECFTGYRTGMLQGPLITVLGCVYSPVERTAEADAMFLSMVSRSCAAIRELDTLAAAAPGA